MVLSGLMQFLSMISNKVELKSFYQCYTLVKSIIKLYLYVLPLLMIIFISFLSLIFLCFQFPQSFFPHVVNSSSFHSLLFLVPAQVFVIVSCSCCFTFSVSVFLVCPQIVLPSAYAPHPPRLPLVLVFVSFCCLVSCCFEFLLICKFS